MPNGQVRKIWSSQKGFPLSMTGNLSDFTLFQSKVRLSSLQRARGPGYLNLNGFVCKLWLNDCCLRTLIGHNSLSLEEKKHIL